MDRGPRKNFKVSPEHVKHGLNLPFWRDNEKLHALEIEEEEMDIDELRWMMSVPFWEDENGDIMLTPNEVLANPERYPEHKELIDKCDTSFAVHITKNSLDEWIIVDGLHRLTKLIMDGKEKIMVKKVTYEQLLTTRMDGT